MNEEIIRSLLKSIQLPDTAYQQAEERYQSIASWLGRRESTLLKYDPQVQPQGSFRLGTSIYPQGREAEYDLDLTSVCKKDLNPHTISQHNLRKKIAYELGGYAKVNGLDPVEDKNRCCRLNYESSAVDVSSFHMDIVPAVPATEERQNRLVESFKNFSVNEVGRNEAVKAILITDKRQSGYENLDAYWLLSNPEGYALWFEERMRNREPITSFSERIDKVPLPTWQRKSVLQSIIQLLKWHRDVMFVNNDDGKPISIIITTLAAQAYEGETSLIDGLLHTLQKLTKAIKPNPPYVPNPVNPEEDFADKWYDTKYCELHLKENFFRWISKAQLDFAILLSRFSSLQDIKKILHDSFNYDIPTKDLVCNRPSQQLLYDDRKDSQYVVVFADHRQRIASEWNININPFCHVDIEAYYGPSKERCNTSFSSGKPLCKGLLLKFLACTDISAPYDVYWQVGNTGQEASNRDCLRGGFYKSDYSEWNKGNFGRTEETSFTGTHWVQCIIIKNGICVGRSKDFVVRIE